MMRIFDLFPEKLFIVMTKKRFVLELHGPAFRHDGLLERFLTLVGEYHKEHRDLGFYADRMCLTPKYLSHAVNKASGKTAAQCITEAVILESIRFFHFLCP